MLSARGKRYERKFPVQDRDIKYLEHLIYQNPRIFREIYSERRVNSIYLDTLDYEYYSQSVSGVSQRKKIRIRWYGDQEGVLNPALEIKKKTDLVNSKDIYSFPSFHIRHFSWNKYCDAIEASGAPESIKVILQQLIPVVKTQYSRKYFLSEDHLCRITLDTDIQYHQIYLENNNLLDSGYHDVRRKIIEIKYEVEHEESIGRYINFFPLRVSKHSKYVTAVDTILGSNVL